MSEKRVVNTSPLIYLSRAGLLDLLILDCEVVIVPQAVVDEIMAWPTADIAQQALQKTNWIQKAAAEPIPSAISAWDLGHGEAAVLAYGWNHPGPTLVIDDLAARRCGAALDIPVRGTLGLVLWAKKKGSIASARSVLAKLRDAGMFLSDAVIDVALRNVGE